MADIIFSCISLANYFDINLEEILIPKYINQGIEQVLKKWGEPIEEWKGIKK